MWKPRMSKSQRRMNSSQTVGALQIPAQKANRSFPIAFTSRDIFWNATTLLNASVAE